MYSDETYLDFTYEDLKHLANKKNMFVVSKRPHKHSSHLTAVQYLLKINLLFLYALSNNN